MQICPFLPAQQQPRIYLLPTILTSRILATVSLQVTFSIAGGHRTRFGDTVFLKSSILSRDKFCLLRSEQSRPRKGFKQQLLDTKQNVVHSEESKAEGQGDANSDAVFWFIVKCIMNGADWNHDSGLDNAGKTTIVKKIMGEDVNSVSPTLGFIIKTINYEG